MSDFTYAAAGAVAPSVLAHLTLHIDAARARGESTLGSVPDERAIARMIDTAFWASLRPRPCRRCRTYSGRDSILRARATG